MATGRTVGRRTPTLARVQRPPTIYDVARAAGVAPSTVSRAFSRPGRVNVRTAEHIRAVAMDLGYHTNPFARGLSTSRNNLLAIVVPDITNPFFFEIIRGAESAAAEAGYTLVLSDTQESARLERLALERTLPMVDGVLLASTRMTDAGIRTHAKQKPLLVLNRAVADTPSVVTDNHLGTRRAAEHLAGLGHRSVTYVAGPEASWADASRWLALRDAAAEVGLRVRRVGPHQPTLVGGAQAVEGFLASRATAALCYNDILAVGLMRGLRSTRVTVPDDVSVVGFDNTLEAELVEPGLTTVSAPLRALGATGVQNLVARLNGARTGSTEPVVLPAALVVRGSTGAPRPRQGRAPAITAKSA